MQILWKRCNSNQWWNNDKCRCECKNNVFKKDFVWNPATCICENGKYLASIMDDSTIISDEIIDVKKRILMKKSNLYNAKFLYFTCIL